MRLGKVARASALAAAVAAGTFVMTSSAEAVILNLTTAGSSGDVIFNAAKGGITLFQGDGAEASHDNLIVNNTVYDPTGSRAAIQVGAGANNNVIFNNIFVSQAAAFEVQAVTGWCDQARGRQDRRMV